MATKRSQANAGDAKQTRKAPAARTRRKAASAVKKAELNGPEVSSPHNGTASNGTGHNGTSHNGTSHNGTPHNGNVIISEQEIQMRAYFKWEAAGKPRGQDARFWLEAEEQLRRT